MQRQTGEMLRMRGATGLLIAVLAGLLLMAAPPSLRSWSEGRSSSQAVQSSDASLAAPSTSAEEKRTRFSPDPRGTALNLNSLAQPAPRQSLSSGALGMCLLALGSIVLLIAAFFLRTSEGRGNHGVRRHP
jgi:uncharacterized protein YjeT (DUF2065 family)